MDCQTSPRPELAGFVDDSLQRADRQRLIRLVFQELYLPPLVVISDESREGHNRTVTVLVDQRGE